VIATGTKYPSPAKSATNDSAGTRAHLEDIRSKVKAANSIVIVGGGPVGVEFAGEIREVYANKKVTIVHDTAQVFDNSGNKKFSNKAHDLLVKNKIDLIYNDVGIIPADVKDPFFVPANKTFQTKSGKTLENVDLVMLAFGNRPDTLWLKNSDFGSSILSSNGYVKVNSKLQVDGQDNLYVLGDAADLKETKMAFRIGSHSSTVLANLTSQIQGGKASTEYKKDSDAMVVTFGSKQGVGLLPLFGGMTIGSWASSKLKGATMFYAKSWESLNLTPPR
jgi:NADH dehydrogenase FAD-containing subunit